MTKNTRRNAKVYRRVVAFLGSDLFLYLVMAVFALQAIWVALSIRFPLLYDEAYHFNLIKVFSHQYSPLITDQLPAYDRFGDLTHQNSLLYHYLLSWPFRLISHFASSTFYQVISLRVINIALFIIGLALYIKLLRRIGAHRTYVNTGLLIFTMLPIVTYVAAHINYDNLIFPLTALLFIICVDILQARNTSWIQYYWLLVVGLSGSLIKFTFLPILFAAVVGLALFKYRQGSRQALSSVALSFVKTSRAQIILLAVPIIVLGALLYKTYAANIIQYHSLKPSCNRTLTVERCLKGPAYIRATDLISSKQQRSASPLPDYTLVWVQKMESGMDITAANIPLPGTTDDDIGGYNTVYGRPLPIFYIFTFSLSVLGVGAVVFNWRRLNKNNQFYLLLLVVMFYILSIFVQNVTDYYKFNTPVAVQPRYLLGILPLVIVLMLICINRMLKNHYKIKATLLVLLLVAILQGGGAITHIVRSSDDLYWQRPKIINANHKLRQAMEPLILE